MDLYLAANAASENYPSLIATSTSVNNCYLLLAILDELKRRI